MKCGLAVALLLVGGNYIFAQTQPVELQLPVCSGTLPQFSVCELKLTPVKSYSDFQAYTQMDVTATFTNTTTGATKLVHAFYDRTLANQLVFKIRFNASETGNWTYSTACSSSVVQCNGTNDTGLNVNSAYPAFNVQASTNPGFVRRDSAYKEKFVYDNLSYANALNPSPYPFLWGQSYYHIVTNEIKNGGWQAAVANSKARRMNKVRMLLYPWWDYLPYHDSQPFTGSTPSPNHDQLNLPHWQHFDKVINYLYDYSSAGIVPNSTVRDSIVAEIILFKDPARDSNNNIIDVNNRTFSPNFNAASGQVPIEDQRYLKYAIARYGAFPNVIWCLANEWQKTQRPDWYWSALGTILAGNGAPPTYDPWMYNGANQQRAVSIHGQTDQAFGFIGQTWFSYLALQFGTSNTQLCARCDGTSTACQQGDDWGYLGITYNLFKLNTCARRLKPVSNDEYGYIGDQHVKVGVWDRNKHRRAMWGIAIAGGYGSAGDLTQDPNFINTTPTISTEWQQQNAYSDIRTMADFFTKNVTRWWEMTTPSNLSSIIASSSTGRVYALARMAPSPNPQYVIYAAAGGTFTVNLPAGNYSYYFFDPRLASPVTTPAPQPFTIDGVSSTSKMFSAPDAANDWVLLVTQN
jgi:hypothetical protein